VVLLLKPAYICLLVVTLNRNFHFAFPATTVYRQLPLLALNTFRRLLSGLSFEMWIYPLTPNALQFGQSTCGIILAKKETCHHQHSKTLVLQFAPTGFQLQGICF
jgi:hypothetical protein